MNSGTTSMGSISRRTFLQRTAAAGAGTTLVGSLLAACGGASTSTSTSTKAASTAFTPSAGTAIPTTTVKVALNPFPDNSFYVIGMQKGWFKEVGINVEPAPFGIKAVPTQSVSYLINNQADVVPMNMFSILVNSKQVPDLRLLGFTDTQTGIYLLASPSVKAPSLSQVMKGGTPFNTAIKQVMAQTKGKQVAFDSSGVQRSFLDLVFNQLGGVRYSDLKLTVTTDPRIVDLAEGGRIDFASVNSNAQVIELLNAGWKPYVSIGDILSQPALRKNQAVAASLGAPGPAVLASFYEAKQEVALRFMAVTWRIIDAIETDPASVIPLQIPYLNSVTGSTTNLNSVKAIYKTLDPLVGFDQQATYMQPSQELYWRTAADAMLKSAQQGGLLPAGQTFDPSMQMIAPEVYTVMRGLKAQYEALAPKLPAGKLADQAKAFYQTRNYLDAYRFAKAA